MRKRLFEVLESSNDGDVLCIVYHYFMMAVITASLVPLAFKTQKEVLRWIELITVGIFILEYLLRMFTADYKLGKGWVSFIMYPFTMMAIIDMLCILPTFTLMASGFRVLKVIRLMRTFRVFRAAKMLRYSKNMVLIGDVMREQKSSLLAVCVVAFSYILVSALVVFNVEPDTFGTFFDAVYWATVSLTTVGYGDIYPLSDAGRVITMISSLFGIAVIALPAGIITAGFMEKLNSRDEKRHRDSQDNQG